MAQGGTTFDTTTQPLRAVAAATEGRFQEIGDQLQASIETIANLTTTFHALLERLNSDELLQATNNLSEIAICVANVAQARNDAVPPFGELTRLITAIEGRIRRMVKLVEAASVLAINSKIAAADIDDVGGNMGTFAIEMAEALRVAKTSLDRFAAELASVSAFLRKSASGQSSLDRGHDAVALAIPLQLGRWVDAFSRRREHASTIALAVERESQRVGTLIGDAVTALQIGDCTCQRIEHINQALQRLEAELDADGVLSELTASERDGPADFVCRLQSAQLIDTANRLDREMEQILRSLSSLAADAGKILRLGSDAFGASRGHRGTVLDELANEVGSVDGLLAGFLAAQQQADQVAASVSSATIRLASEIQQVRSLEADIHIMGLNMIFKSNRLGVPGRPLAVIARELRVYGQGIAREASDVMIDLGRIVAISEGLTDSLRRDRAADVVPITHTMAASVACVTATGQSLAEAWDMLDHDGNRVAALLKQSSIEDVRHREASRTLRQAARDLVSVFKHCDVDIGSAPPQLKSILAAIAGSYTMEAERRVFARHVRADTPPEELASPRPGAVKELDEIFF